MSGTVTEEQKRDLIRKHEIAHALDGLLDLYDTLREIGEDCSCDEMWDLVNDGAVEIFGTYIWEIARREASRQKRADRAWSEVRMGALLRRIEQITDTPPWQMGENVSLDR